MRVRAMLVALAAATGAVVAAPAAASAGGAGVRAEPWRPVVQEEWTAPAGRFCDFPLSLRVVSQDIRGRVLDRYDDGAVRVEEFAGPLVVDFVNGDTGASVRRDAGGRAVAEYRPDGRYRTYAMFGPVGLGMPDGATGLPKGYYVVDGLHVVEFAESGARTVTTAYGTEDNVCGDLA